jgi:hypothetical protein
VATRPAIETRFYFFVFLFFIVVGIFLFSFHPLLAIPSCDFNDTFSAHFFPLHFFLFQPLFLRCFLSSLSFASVLIVFTYFFHSFNLSFFPEAMTAGSLETNQLPFFTSVIFKFFFFSPSFLFYISSHLLFSSNFLRLLFVSFVLPFIHSSSFRRFWNPSSISCLLSGREKVGTWP